MAGIHIVDIFEVLVNLALVYYYLQVRDSITLVPWAVILMGNLLPLSLRMFGMILRVCGGRRVWTRGAFFCTRLFGILFQFLILTFQVVTTYFVI